jgi:oxaloacetate decarboxylase alpha subunit
MVFALKQLGYDVGVKEEKIKAVNDFFKPYQAKVVASGLLDPKVMGTDADALVYQVPGGMLSNLVAQLKAQNAMDKFDEVLAEVPKVRKDLGYPPLVTPSSQMVGVQATQNVLAGERYKMISKEIKAYLRGEYGTPPGEVDAELVKKVLGDEKPLEVRFADTLAPGLEDGKKAIGELAHSEEDVLSYILFPQIAEEFFRKRDEREQNRVSYSIVRKES